ncbi:MAG: tetratricopeptide repeat protein [Planctomycetaceae bacterium]|nr:tetratricopeptide repeat protein [Planctomycetaceae bacterium]
MRTISTAICLFTFILGSGCQSGTGGFRNPFTNPFARSIPENSTGLVAKSKINAQDQKPNVFEIAQQEAASQPEPPAVASVRPIPDSLGQSDRDLKQPLSKIDQLLSQADQAFDKKLPAKAAAFYDEAVRMDPANVHAHHRLAMIADMQENYSLAESHYTAALKVDSNNLNLLNDLGYSYYLQHNYEESQAYLSYVLQMDPSHHLAMKNLGLVLAAQGNTQEAYALLQQGGLNPGESQQKIQQAMAHASQRSVNRNPSGIVSLNNNTNPGTQRIQPTAGEYNFPNHNSTRNNNFNSSLDQFGTGNSRSNQPSSFYESNHQQDLRNSPHAPVPTRVEKPANPNDYSQYDSNRSQQSDQGRQDYLLERAALNTGFGNLFPITSSEEYHRAQQARPVSWEQAPAETADARRAYYEQFGNPPNGTPNVHNAHHPPPSAASTPNFYRSPQTPVQQTGMQSQNSGSQNRYAVPVTQPSSQPQSPAQYDQFPQNTAPHSQSPDPYQQPTGTSMPTYGSPSQNTGAMNTQNPPRNALREYQQGLQEFESSPFNQTQYR